MSMIIQIIGSIGVLLGFALAQWGILTQKSKIYLIMNAVAPGMLALDAIFEHQWGFLLLEGSWSIISVAELVRMLISRKKDTPFQT